MKTTVTMIALAAAVTLTACGKKEEVKPVVAAPAAATPAPVAAPAASEPAKTEEAKK